MQALFKMRLCILSSFEDSLSRDTGYSVRIYNLAKNLSKLNNEVFLIIPGFNTDIQRVDGIVVYKIQGSLPKWLLKIVGRLLGITKVSSLYFHDPVFIIKTSKIARYCNVVQIEQQSTGMLFAIIANKLWRKPVVADCHDVLQALRVKHIGTLRKMLETLNEKIFYRFVNIILAVSEEEKNLLRSFVLNAPIEVIPNGVDISEFNDQKSATSASGIRMQYGLDGIPVVTFVGNLEYLPNMEAVELIASKIAPIVKKEIPTVKFLIVGRIGKMIKKVNVQDLIFTGTVNDVAEVLLASDVAIAPLLQGSGTRLKILEYFSCALPVVSTSIGVSGLKVENNVHALITDDIEEFSRMIIKLLNNRDIAFTLGQSARQLVLMNYNWELISKKLNAIYEKLMEKENLKSLAI